MTTDLFKLTEDHDAVREAIREIAEAEIAPHAADVDDNERFPIEARKALNASGFQAVHIAEAYDGAGADAVATVIVIEEVARVCASSSLIPAVNKLGSMPIILSGSDELKRKVLPSIASGEEMISYALSEREAGSDAAAMRTKAVADGDDWVLNGIEELDHQRRGVHLVHRDGRHRSGGPTSGGRHLRLRRACRRSRFRAR